MTKLAGKITLFGALIGAICCASLGHVHAQQWPARPITFVVPFPAGGSSDSIARPLSILLERQLKQTIVIENRGGAGGTIGASIAAKASPDGYTLFLGAAHHAIAVSLYPTLSYDLEKDLIPLALVARPPHVVVVNPAKVPVSNLAEFITLAKANPRKFNFASAGQGTTLHLTGELFQSLTGTQFNHVPYRGNAPAMRDLIAGHVDLMFDNLASSASQINEGKIRALAVAHPERVETIKQIPTAKEAGLDSFEVTTWYVLFAVKGTPPEIIERMKKEIAVALQTEEIKTIWNRNGSDVPSLTGPALSSYISSEIQRWSVVVKERVPKSEATTAGNN